MEGVVGRDPNVNALLSERGEIMLPPYIKPLCILGHTCLLFLLPRIFLPKSLTLLDPSLHSAPPQGSRTWPPYLKWSPLAAISCLCAFPSWCWSLLSLTACLLYYLFLALYQPESSWRAGTLSYLLSCLQSLTQVMNHTGSCKYVWHESVQGWDFFHPSFSPSHNANWYW